jgi:DUF4097 and DUF4098 domain-containing protein YvlB
LTLVLIAAAMPAVADARFEESLKLEPGGKLIVDTSAGSVEIRGTSRSGARIVVTSSRDDLKDRYDFKFEEGPGTVTITSRKKGSWINWHGNDGAPQFQIEVPEKTTLEVGTGGGHVQVMSINGNATLKTSGGHMEISSLTGKLMAKTSGGHIKLRKIDGDTTISTSGRHIEVDGLNAALDARTSGGHVSIKSVSGSIDTHTSGGHIDIENAGGRVEAGPREATSRSASPWQRERADTWRARAEESASPSTRPRTSTSTPRRGAGTSPRTCRSRRRSSRARS